MSDDTLSQAEIDALLNWDEELSHQKKVFEEVDEELSLKESPFLGVFEEWWKVINSDKDMRRAFDIFYRSKVNILP
jgi:flagellar motor switch protein FliM